MRPAQFATLIRELAAREVLVQSADRTLLAGVRGDREINHYSFFAAFRTEEEYRLVCGDTTLGTMPVGQPMRAGQLLIFAARRWRVVAVHDEDKVMELAPAAGGVPALTGAPGGHVHSVVRAKMRAILAGDDQFPYLDPTAARMLKQARNAYGELRLDERAILRDGGDTLVVAWTDDRENGTLAQLLVNEGLDATVDGLVVRVGGAGEPAVSAAVHAIAAAAPPTEIELARQVGNKIVAKYDSWLGDELLSAEYATTHLDCAAAVAVAQEVCGTGGSAGG